MTVAAQTSETQPDPEFVPVEPDLEDVYFCAMHRLIGEGAGAASGGIAL